MSFAAVLSRLAKLENPYPGLRPFDTAEAHLFFGRDQQVLDLADRLGRNHFVAVLGLSGSGKSSLVRAGLIPALERGRLLEPGHTWRIAITRPSGSPFANLADELKCDSAELRSSSHGLVNWARRQLNPSQQSLLVVVDQFEELFRYKDSTTQSQKNATAGSEASAFIALLLASAHSPLPIYIVITMRTDYLGDCAEFPDFPETLNESQYLVPRLTREQRRQAIEGPLGRARISSSLVERILNDAGDEPDQLPILQHSLMRTWARWNSVAPDNTRPISDEDYEAIGRFSGALNQHADELLKTPAATATPGFVEIIFRRLTALGRNNRERRDPALLSELWELCNARSAQDRQRANNIIDVFRQGQATFLAPREGELKPETFIDIAHESLIRNWNILAQQWLPDEEKQAKTLVELLDRANGWRAKERDLLAGLDLASAVQWDRRRNQSPVWAEHYVGVGKLTEVQAFIAASRKRRIKQFLLLLPFLLGIIAFSWQSYRQQKTTESLNLAGKAETLISLGKSSDAVATAEQAISIRPTPQSRLALAHAFPQELVEFRGHTGPVYRAVFSPDEHQILTASADHSAQLWNAATGASVLKLPLHAAEVRSARFSPDGQRIVTAGDHTAHLCDASTGKLIATLSNHTGDVNSALFSPNGQHVATASNDFTARIWDASTGLPQAVLKGHKDFVYGAVFSPDSQRIVTASRDTTARVWDLAGNTVATLSGHQGEVRTAIFSPDGRQIVTASADKTSHIWDAATGKSLFTLTHASTVNSASFSKDGKLVVTASDDQTAAIWDATTGQRLTQLKGHASYVVSASFSPDGQHVVTASRDSTIHIWDAHTGTLIANLTGHNGSVDYASFSSDGLRILSAGEDSTARLWNIAAAADVTLTLTGHADGVNAASFAPDDKSILTASLDHSAFIWDRATGKLIRKLVGHAGSVNGASFSRDGTRIATASSDHTARVWDRATGNVITKVTHADEVSSAVFSPDGTRLLTASNDKTARISDAATGHPIFQLVGHHGNVLNASFSPDGKLVATASDDQTAMIWDATTGKALLKITGHTGTVWTAAFSHDSKTLVTASDDGTARLWDVSTGKQLLTLAGHSGAVYSAAFSPDGKSVATASYDKSVRLWNPSTGQVIAKLESHSDSVSTASFSHNSQSLVTASLDRTSLLFHLLPLPQ